MTWWHLADIGMCNQGLNELFLGICRRQVFWIAKQILQLGMGDAVDDWLMSQIQFLMKEYVVVTSIKAVENVC